MDEAIRNAAVTTRHDGPVVAAEMAGEVFTRRVNTVVLAEITALTFAFGFANVWALRRSLGVPAFVAPLVGPAVDLSVAGLLIGIRHLSMAGIPSPMNNCPQPRPHLGPAQPPAGQAWQGWTSCWPRRGGSTRRTASGITGRSPPTPCASRCGSAPCAHPHSCGRSATPTMPRRKTPERSAAPRSRSVAVTRTRAPPTSASNTAR
jgi:hypothetical protein